MSGLALFHLSLKMSAVRRGTEIATCALICTNMFTFLSDIVNLALLLHLMKTSLVLFHWFPLIIFLLTIFVPNTHLNCCCLKILVF